MIFISLIVYHNILYTKMSILDPTSNYTFLDCCKDSLGEEQFVRLKHCIEQCKNSTPNYPYRKCIILIGDSAVINTFIEFMFAYINKGNKENEKYTRKNVDCDDYETIYNSTVKMVLENNNIKCYFQKKFNATHIPYIKEVLSSSFPKCPKRTNLEDNNNACFTLLYTGETEKEFKELMADTAIIQNYELFTFHTSDETIIHMHKRYSNRNSIEKYKQEDFDLFMEYMSK